MFCNSTRSLVAGYIAIVACFPELSIGLLYSISLSIVSCVCKHSLHNLQNSFAFSSPLYLEYTSYRWAPVKSLFSS